MYTFTFRDVNNHAMFKNHASGEERGGDHNWRRVRVVQHPKSKLVFRLINQERRLISIYFQLTFREVYYIKRILMRHSESVPYHLAPTWIVAGFR